jgi:hypothetical protein
MAYYRHGLEKTEYMREESTKEDIWTNDGTRNVENKN